MTYFADKFLMVGFVFSVHFSAAVEGCIFMFNPSISFAGAQCEENLCRGSEGEIQGLQPHILNWRTNQF